jgi:hypothetical protein
MLTNPEQLSADLERMIEIEREGARGNPDRKANTWLEKLAEVGQMRGAYQEMAAKGLITFEELGAKLEELETTREAATQELESLRNRRERIQELERDRDALLEYYVGMAPEALGSLLPEERHQVYKMLRLKVAARMDGELEVTGALGENVCTDERTSACTTRETCSLTRALG